METNQSDLHFRSPLWSAFWSTLLGVVPFWLLSLPVFVSLSPRFRVPLSSVILGWTLFLVAAGLLFSWFLIKVSLVTVKVNGIRGYDAWGDYSFVTWDEIDVVKPYNLIGLRYLRVFFQHSSPLWVPLFLAHQDQFVAAVIERAPSTNPLRLALEGNWQKDVVLDSSVEAKVNLPMPSIERKPSSQTYQPSAITLPWMLPNVFPASPASAYGYRIGDKCRPCSQLSLVESLKSDTNKKIALVWTPETTHLIPPEEVPFLFEAVCNRERNYLKQRRSLDIVNSLIWGLLVLISLREPITAQIMLFNWAILGLVPLIEHSWQLYYLRSQSPDRMAQRISEARYWAWIRNAKAPWTWALVDCLALVGIIQFIIATQSLFNKTHSSIAVAGLIKQAVWQGEAWRLLTGTLLHVNILHFLFNVTALLFLGKLLEIVAHRVYVPLVFVLAALGGSLFSLILLPNTTSVGASGGIMGLLGFLIVLGWTQKHHFPSAFLRSLLLGVLYTAAAGLLAYQIIDNPAHLGGLLTGLLLGRLFIPLHSSTIPLAVPRVLEVTGMLAGVMILCTALFCSFKMLVG